MVAVDGDDEFYEGLEELAEESRKLVAGEEGEPREERGRDIDIHFLREIIYGLETVSLGTHQLLYFSALKYARRYLDADAEDLPGAVDDLADIFDATNLGTLELVEDGNPARVALRENAFTCNAPQSGRTMCYFLSGYIAGFMEGALDGRYVVNELECSADGNDACVFEIRER